jgi:hypothetical protein
MNDPRRADTTPLNPPSDPPRDDANVDRTNGIIDDVDALLEDGDFENPGDDNLTGVERYEGYLEAGESASGTESLDTLMTDELRAGETIDPNVAAEEGLAWIPPSDPVVVPDPDDPEGLAVAAGFGSTALDDPYDLDHHDSFLSDESEMTDRVREALRADARTSRLADRLVIATIGSTAVIRGVVDDVEDSDLVEEVVSEVTGISEVRDETELAS